MFPATFSAWYEPILIDKRSLQYLEKMKSYDHANCNEFSYFETWWQKVDHHLLWLKRFHYLPPDLLYVIAYIRKFLCGNYFPLYRATSVNFSYYIVYSIVPTIRPFILFLVLLFSFISIISYFKPYCNKHRGIYQSVLISFPVLIDTTTFETKLSSLELYLKIFLDWVATAAVPTAKGTLGKMAFKPLRKRFALRMSQLPTG